MTLQQKTICLLLLRDEIDEGLSSVDVPKTFFFFLQTVWKLEGVLYFWKQACGAHGGCRWRQGFFACVRCAHLRQSHVVLIHCMRTDSLLNLQSFSPPTLHGVSVPVTPALPRLAFFHFWHQPSCLLPRQQLLSPPHLCWILWYHIFETLSRWSNFVTTGFSSYIPPPWGCYAKNIHLHLFVVCLWIALYPKGWEKHMESTENRKFQMHRFFALKVFFCSSM